MKRWPTKPLEEIAELYGGSTPSRDSSAFWGGDIHWVTPTDLPMPDEGISIVTKTKDRITQTGLDNSSATVVPKGTVLFSSRATIGKVAVADMPLTTNQGFANFVPRSEVTSRFLAYALWFHRKDIARLSGSTTFKEVSRSTLRKYHLPVPPLVEQDRIVKLLDEADELRKLRAQADRRTAALLPALFHEMFGDPVTNPHGWTKSTLGELCGLVNGAPFKPSDWDGSGLPIIRIQNLNDSTKPFNYTSKQLSEKFRVRPGDILLSWSGTPGTSFGCFRWSGPEGWLNQHIFNVQLQPGLDGEFFIQSVNVRLGELIARAHGGVGLQHVTKGVLNAVEMLVPPLELQQKFARRVSEIRQLEDGQAASRLRLEDLFQSVLYRAFQGEL